MEIKGFQCVYFNAWENDFCDDPFFAFFAELQESVDELKYKGRKKEKIKNFLDEMKTLGGHLLRQSLPIGLKLAAMGLGVDFVEKLLSATGEELSQAMEKLGDDKITEYKNEKETREKFKNNLGKLASLIIGEDDETKPPIVIFVDELDRCRPTYAIELLENIKHLFSVEGIFFVLGLDREQLAHSVKSVYGAGMEADGYLRRFIDLEYQLPDPSLEDYCNYLWDVFALDEVYGKNVKGSQPIYQLRTTLLMLSSLFYFSLRELNQFFSRLNIVIRLITFDNLLPEYLVFLMALKLSKPTLYNQLNEGTKNYLEVIDQVIAENKDNEFFQSNEWIQIELYLHKSFYTGDDPDKFVDERNNKNNRYRVCWGDNYTGGIKYLTNNPHPYLIKKIEFSERFSP